MTPAQLISFKAAILADGTQTANVSAGAHGSIAAYYNTVPPSPTMLWRPVISISELNTAIVWADFTSLPVASQNAYMALISPGTIDATSANVRAGFGTVFAGKPTLTNLTALAQRPATRFEAQFAVGQVSPMFGQSLSVSDVITALGS